MNLVSRFFYHGLRNFKESLVIFEEINHQFRLSTFLDVTENDPPTYRICDTKNHNRFGRQFMSKKGEWKSDRIYEVIESARKGEEKFQVSEGLIFKYDSFL